MINSKSRWRFNYRFAAWFFGLFALLAVVLYFWHDYQFAKSSTLLLERARRQEEKGEWEPLVKSLRRYLQMSPEDDEAWQMLAKAEDQRAHSFSGLVDAARVHGRVLARPGLTGNVPLRLRYARLLLDTGRYEDAIEQAGQVERQGTEQERQSAEIVHALALFEQAVANTEKANWGEVLAAIEAAIKSSPTPDDDIELTVRLAALYRDETVKLLAADTPVSKEERDSRADQAMDALVGRHPELAMAYLTRYRYRLATKSATASADLEAAIARAGKEEVEVWFAAADAALASSPGRPDQLRAAKQYYERAREASPLDRRVYIGLVRTHMLIEAAEPNGQSVAAAEQVIKDGLKQISENDFELKLWQARVFLASGQDKQLEAALRELSAQREANQLAWSAAVRSLAQLEIDRISAERLLSRGELSAAAEAFDRMTRAEQGIAVDADARQLSWAGNPYQTWMSLGRCRDALQEADRAARAYEQALRISPSASDARRAAARAWTAAGRPDLAAPHLDLNTGESDVIAQLDQIISRMRQLRPDERDWTDVRRQLQALSENPATRFRAYLLTAQVELESRDRSAAVAAIQKAEQTPASTSAEWRALIAAYQAVDADDDAERCFALLAKVATPAEVALVRAESLTGEGRLAAAEQALRSAIVNAADEQADALNLALAKMLLSQSRFAEAKAQLETAAQSKSANRREAIRLLAGLHLETKDWPALERYEKLLQEVDGADSTEWRYFRANRLLQNPASDDAALAEAADLANAISKARPDWLVAIQLEAEVAERQQRFDQAIAAYERAVGISAGTELELRFGSRLVELAFGRAGASGELPPSIVNTLAGSPVLSAAAISRSVAEGNHDRALHIATAAAQLRPRDPLAQFWLGQTQLLSGQADAAAASLGRAVEGGADFTLAWESLLQVLMASGKSAQAVQLVSRLEANKSLPEPDRSLLLARARTLTGEAKAAEAAYRQVAAQFPQDANVLRACVAFFAGRDVALAEKMARDALALAPTDVDARRLLAGVLGARGSRATFDEAAALLGAAGENLPTEEADLRQFAQLLSRRPDLDSRRKAVTILAGLAARKEVVPSQERLALAALYESTQQHASALQELAALNARSKVVVPDHLAALVEYAIRHPDGVSSEHSTAVDQALASLQAREPDSWRTFALTLRRDRQRDATLAIAPRLAKYMDQTLAQAATPEARAALLARTAELCTSLEDRELAETYFRQAAEAAPQGRRALAMFLAGKAESNATREAIGLCLSKDAEATAADAATLCMALTVSGATDAEFQRAEPAIRAALAKFPEDASLMFAWGSLALVRGLDDEAERALQKALELSPANSLALNNLAYLRVGQGKPSEALELVERAIAVSGPASNFLDTRGLALIGDQRFAEAVRAFQDLTAAGADPVTHLHLARAQLGLGERAAAKASLAQAQALKLNPSTLPAYDRRSLAELETALQN